MPCEKCGGPLEPTPDRFYWKGEGSSNDEEDMIKGPDVEIYVCKECGHENIYYR